MGPYCIQKFQKYFSYAVCTQLRRRVHKHIIKRRYRDEKPGCFVFGKPVVFTLDVGLTTPNSLGLLV